jgi:hypothetical protein
MRLFYSFFVEMSTGGKGVQGGKADFFYIFFFLRAYSFAPRCAVYADSLPCRKESAEKRH